jgi:hypothetical protein
MRFERTENHHEADGGSREWPESMPERGGRRLTRRSLPVILHGEEAKGNREGRRQDGKRGSRVAALKRERGRAWEPPDRGVDGTCGDGEVRTGVTTATTKKTRERSSPETVLDLRDGFWAARGIFQMGCRDRFKLEQRAALLGKKMTF